MVKSNEPEQGAAQFAVWSSRIAGSDRKAYTELFEATSGPLFRYALRLVHSEEIAEDLVQDAFLRIWQKRSELDPNRSLRAFLYTVVRNLALSHDRVLKNRKSLLAQMEHPVSPSSPEETVNTKWLGIRIRQWINELPDRRKEAFQLSRFDGLSYEEIANIMGVSIKTVDNHVWKALSHLKSRLETHDRELLIP